MQIQVEHLGNDQAVIKIAGRIDSLSSPAVRQAILDEAEAGMQAVVVDMAGVDFMDSSGLSALIAGMKALRKRNGTLSLCNAHAQIRTALRLTMLDQVFPVHDSVETALESIRKTG